jgi:hypothetical protein
MGFLNQHLVTRPLIRVVKSWCTPVRTLLYELFIEPIVELWQRVLSIPGFWNGDSTPVLSSDPTGPATLPSRRSLPKP